MSGVDWGSVPDWFAAVGTVGALLVALVLLGKEMSDRREAKSRADRYPADGIFAWAAPRTDAGGWQTFLLNTTSEPVYDVVVRFQRFADTSQVSESVFGTLPPGGPTPGDRYGDRPDDVFGIPPVEIEFTDGRSRYWLRNFDGQLRELEARMPFD